MRVQRNLLNWINAILPVQSLCKTFPFSRTPNQIYNSRIPGRIAIVTNAGWGAVDAAAFCVRRDCRASRKTLERSPARGREMQSRTAKSCGPDAPTLASSLRSGVGPTGLRQNLIRETTVAKEPGHRGARYKPLRPLRAGMPGDSGVLVVARVRSTTTIAHEAAGATGTRHSPRPQGGER